MKILLLVLAFLPAHLRGQEVKTVLIRTLCFQRDSAGIDKLAIIQPDHPVIQMKFPESFPSPLTKVPVTEGKVTFHNATNLSGPPIASAAIPSRLNSVIILFFPADPGKDGMVYRTSVIDASLDGIPENGALVMNLFSKEVRVVVGEHRIILKPGKSAGIARPKERNDYNMSPVVFLAEVGGEWKTASETLVRFPEGQQQFFISYPDATTTRLAFRSYQIDGF